MRCNEKGTKVAIVSLRVDLEPSDAVEVVEPWLEAAPF